MVNFVNSIKAFLVCALTTGLFTLHATTADFQDQLAREGQEVGKIEALMHYSTLTDVWSRMLYGWLHLFFYLFHHMLPAYVLAKVNLQNSTLNWLR